MAARGGRPAARRRGVPQPPRPDRRRAPTAAAAVPAALSLAVTPELFTSTFSPALVTLSFLLGRRTGSVRRSLAAVAGLCTSGLVLALTLPGADLWDWFTLVTIVLFAAVLPWLLGRFRRQQYALQAAGWDLAARMEREQRLVADRARLRERSRIAGDMDDSLGHDLSLIAVRAAALQVSPGVDDAARAPAAELRQAAADATQRLSEIIGLLRQDSAAPTAESVPDLVARTAASGVRITLRRPAPQEPGPLPVVPVVPALVDRAVHRVVQEAVTNATKHAPGAPITVELGQEGGTVHVTVVNGAPEPAPLPEPGTTTAAGSGTGLISLDERVRQAGGTFRARPHGDGYEVTARLPLTPHQAPPSPPPTPPRRRPAPAPNSNRPAAGYAAASHTPSGSPPPPRQSSEY